MPDKDIHQFKKFDENYKLYEKDKAYSEMSDVNIKFDSEKELVVSNLTDPELIIKEIATISKKQYFYNAIYESQKRVLQQVEDEYAKWYNEKYMEIDNETTPITGDSGRVAIVKVKRTGTQKDITIKTKWSDEYEKHQDKIRDEKHKLGLVSIVKKSLDSYSYKLSNINEYAKNLE